MAQRILAALLLIAAFFLTFPANAQQAAKPFTQEQVQAMVRDGLGDETGAKALAQRGIDFAPTEDFIQSLKTAGASEAFLAALRAAKPPEPASAKKPLDQVRVITLLAGQVPSHRVAMLVQERGIDFEPTDDYVNEVRLAGGEDELISALKGVKVTKPATVDPAAQARQTEVRQHVARGAEFFQKRQYAQAEQEYRAALLLDPQNADLYDSLANALGQQNKWDDAASAAREAIRLNPNNDMAHISLGITLEGKADWDGAISEQRAALRLDPSNDLAHANLGLALEGKGDWDGAIAKERVAVRLDGNNGLAHGCLGSALGHEGDLDGAIIEFREALRLNPNDEETHIDLGVTLGRKGDWDGAIAEYHDALRLNPNNCLAHFNLGTALGSKGDLDGAIIEFRDALRLNPQNSSAHFGLGITLEQKGDHRGALEECRAAYMLDPTNVQFRQVYEALLREINGP